MGIIRNVEVELGAKLRDQREAQGEEGAKLRKCAARLAAARAKLATGDPGGARGTLSASRHTCWRCMLLMRAASLPSGFSVTDVSQGFGVEVRSLTVEQLPLSLSPAALLVYVLCGVAVGVPAH